MRILKRIGNAIGAAWNAVKTVAQGMKKLIDFIKKIFRMFMTQVGMIIGLMILVLVVAIIILVMIKTLEYEAAKWFDPDFAGVSTAGDYEYLVSSLGYSGYDSLITEKNWQEFNAYEYAVLMDVAEYIWEGQEKMESGDENSPIDTVLGPYSQSYYDGVRTAASEGDADYGPAHLPYLPVNQDYDCSKLTKEDWNKLVLAGQVSARFGISNAGELGNDEFNTSNVIMGGNRDVMQPTLTYEYRTNPYEPEGDGSLIPYVSVLKEQLKYHYFTIGDKGTREMFEGLGENPDSGGVNFTEEHIDQVDLMEISNFLNIENAYIEKSTVWSDYILNSGTDPRTGEQEAEAWPVADTVYEQDLYFTNEYASVMYKTPLQVMIDRYLPKASLLTAWYYLKDTDIADAETQGKSEQQSATGEENKFKIEQLMRDVKGIYNYYCWEEESLTTETIQAVQYSGDGTVIRNESGDNEGKAILADREIEYATSNNQTFIHFGQAGIEANLFNVFELYDPQGEHQNIPRPQVSATITGDSEEVTVPVITELLSENSQFMDRFGFKVTFDYTYQYSYNEVSESNAETKTFIIGYSCVGNHMASPKIGENINIYDNANPGNCAYSCYEIRTTGWDGRKIQKIEENNVSAFKVTLGGETSTSVDSDRTTEYANGTGSIIVPYEATNNISPRGDSYTMDTLSQLIHDEIVLEAERRVMENEALQNAAAFEVEHMESEFVNNTYWYPTETKDIDGKIHAKTLSYFDEGYRDHGLGFYNFSAISGDVDPSTNYDTETELKNLLASKINEVFAETGNPLSEDHALYDPLVAYLKAYYNQKLGGSLTGTASQANYSFDGITSITNINITQGIANGASGYEQTNLILNGDSLESTAVAASEYNKGLVFTNVKDQEEPYNAIYDIDDYVITMSMNVPQKRISTMIVTDVEAWAKSADYNIQITNNVFDYTNYRYVVPHSFFSFGVKKFRIDENPTYRTHYYKEYFSKIGDPNAAIKEADVLTMMLKWEEFARAGNDTAYAFMRDLYKLIIYIREKFEGDEAQILDTAYTYLYVPDTIWEFREGISQEAFWTERLAAEMPGNADAMSDEELKKVRVKKDEISWQILDYDEYAECQYEEGGVRKARIYALFPFGSPYTRTFFMQNALNSGTFNDGGYKNGHNGADWHSRATSAMILAAGTQGADDAAVAGGSPDKTIAEQIYDYELKLRTARKILNSDSTNTADAKDVLLNGLEGVDDTGDVGSRKAAAEREIQNELEEYIVKSPIVSVAGGLVTRAHYDCYSGFAVAVTHTASGREARTSYVHMRRWPDVQENDIVGPGTVVGYEGNTGNSRGNHLHQNLYIGGSKDSPAEYMGPIFAPFYNKEKIFETIGENEWNNDDDIVLIFGTEYMELIRTVLMYPFTDGEAFDSSLLDGGNMLSETMDGTTFMLDCSFESIPESPGEYYVNYSGDTSDGTYGYYSGDGQIVIKVGTDPSKYYLCDVVNETESPSGEESEYNYNGGGQKRLRVANVTELEEYDVVLSSGIRVKVDEFSYSQAPVVWGNNVPLAPLIEDMTDAMDITSLNTLKTFDPTEYAAEYENDLDGPPKKTTSADAKDVTADPILFTPDENRLDVPEWILAYMTDLDSPYSVPFYDGPISVEMQNTLDAISGTEVSEWAHYNQHAGYPGWAGSQSGDLIALKKAIKMKGLVSGDNEINVESGEFDEAFKNLWIQVSNTPGYEDLKTYEPGTANGELGQLDPYGKGDGMHFSNYGVCVWNAIVTYGSVEKAQNAGRAATEMAAVATGLLESFVQAIATHESGFLPTAESREFCAGCQDISYLSGDNLAFPTETTSVAECNGVIEYDGVRRTLRRATGLMQLAPGTGLSLAQAKAGNDIGQIISMMRSPRSNAILGAELLSDNMNSIVANESLYAQLKANVDDNPNFAEMAADSGLNPYQIALMGASCLMYNQGPGNGNTEAVISAMKSIEYDGSNVTGGNECNMGYWKDVMEEVVAAEKAKKSS